MRRRLAMLGALASAIAGPAAADPSFVEVIVDPGMAGDVKLAGDIDGDGRTDLIVGGSPGEDLVWYRNPDWQRLPIGAARVEFTTDGALGDLDGDGDLDIVTYDGPGQGNLLWFANPGDGAARWDRTAIGSAGGWGKDVELADLDNDGRLDVAGRSPDSLFLYFSDGAAGWTRVDLPMGGPGGEGLAVGDLDGDQRADIILSGLWLRNPGGSRSRSGEAWTRRPVGPAPGEFKAAVADIDGDGRADIVYSASESTADLTVWSRMSDPAGDEWRPRVVQPDIDRAHTLAAADMDLDGDIDIVLAQMNSTPEGGIWWMENLDGAGTDWRRHRIGTGGLHNGVLADIDGDGRPDLFGANYTGNPPVRFWLNRPRD